MKRTAICLSTALLLSLGGVASAQDDGNVDALLKDLEGILTDVMGDDEATAPATGSTASAEPTGADVPMEDVAGDTVAPPTRTETASADPAPDTAGAMDAGDLERQLADMLSGIEGQSLDTDVTVDEEPEPTAAPELQPEPEVAAAEPAKPTDSTEELATMEAGDIVMPAPAADPAAPAVSVGVEVAVGDRPTTVAIPDADGMIEMQPATPEVPPAVAVDADPTRSLLAGEVEKMFNQGLSWFAVGEYSRAAARMEEVLWADPKHTEARYYLAYCRYKMGDFRQARAEFHALYQVKYDFTPVRRGVMAELGNTGASLDVAPAVGMEAATGDDAPLDLDLNSAFETPAAPKAAPKSAPAPAPAPASSGDDDEVLGVL